MYSIFTRTPIQIYEATSYNCVSLRPTPAYALNSRQQSPNTPSFYIATPHRQLGFGSCSPTACNLTTKLPSVLIYTTRIQKPWIGQGARAVAAACMRGLASRPECAV
ncbi:hypothetical protein SETIT_5G304200v2 [Setaria italica]|uniref:Uncharacterized protein n=1 Tax=Setaria italica TaxID=4555 RepID=A0A368RAM1_SETIT|nr:hypothetical protein SETIT_5G304200v2 [Setaria italica]